MGFNKQERLKKVEEVLQIKNPVHKKMYKVGVHTHTLTYDFRSVLNANGTTISWPHKYLCHGNLV